MGRKPTPRPSFFKVMIGDFTNKIRIPPAFMKNFNGMLPHESILRSDTGRFWRVQMEVVDQDLFFQNGWPEFVKDHALEVGDFLIFWFLGNSTFDVRIYGRTGCEKKVALPKRNGKAPISFIKKERQGKGMGKFFKRSPSFQCKCHEGNQKKQVDVTGKSKTTDVKPKRRLGVKIERQGVLEKSHLFKSKHPFFVSTFKHYNRYHMYVPKEFAIEISLKGSTRMVLKDPHGRLWPVVISVRQRGRVDLGAGWDEFQSANSLAKGDTCIFEFFRRGKVLRVHIFRANEGIGRI